MVNRLENLKNPFRKGSKSYKIAQLLLEKKSYDEIKKSIPGVVKQTFYNIRSELKRKGFIGKKQKTVIISPKMLDEASQENRMRTLNQLLMKKLNEQSREEIEAMAKELGVNPEFLESLIEEKTRTQIAKEMAKVTQEKREKPVSLKGSLRTVPIMLSGSQLKVPTSSNLKEPVSPVTSPLQTAPKKLEGDGEKDLAAVIL